VAAHAHGALGRSAMLISASLARSRASASGTKKHTASCKRLGIALRASKTHLRTASLVALWATGIAWQQLRAGRAQRSAGGKTGRGRHGLKENK